jgi:hypothetical protein
MTDEPVNAADAIAMVEEQQKIVAAIKPLLSGKHPALAGAVLTELVALWLAGHNPKSREAVFEHWVSTTVLLIPPCEDEIFRGGPRPPGWNE